jgi:hypothetical protein
MRNAMTVIHVLQNLVNKVIKMTIQSNCQVTGAIKKNQAYRDLRRGMGACAAHSSSRHAVGRERLRRCRVRSIHYYAERALNRRLRK